MTPSFPKVQLPSKMHIADKPIVFSGFDQIHCPECILLGRVGFEHSSPFGPHRSSLWSIRCVDGETSLADHPPPRYVVNPGSPLHSQPLPPISAWHGPRHFRSRPCITVRVWRAVHPVDDSSVGRASHRCAQCSICSSSISCVTHHVFHRRPQRRVMIHRVQGGA